MNREERIKEILDVIPSITDREPTILEAIQAYEGLADYVNEAIEKALTDKEIEEAHLWETLFKKDGLPKRIDQAKEELDELDEQLDLVKYKPSQKLSDKEKINLRDEIVDVGMMLESLMIIFKVTASSVAMRKLAKMDKLKTYAYGTNRSVGNVENKGKTTYGY